MPIRSTILHSALAAITLWTTGCGTDCQSTCTKLYGGAPNCGDPNGADPEAEGYIEGVIGAGQDEEEMTRQCMSECEGALSKPGDAGDYKPNEFLKQTETVSLENDEMAALWMDCVEEQSCENLASRNYCAPVW
jgi:hypothetical protein